MAAARAVRRLAGASCAALIASAAALALWPAPRPAIDALSSSRRYDVRILRDTWGVPHVFGHTDRDVAYGLAWAHAEDDFSTIQGALLASRGRLATLLGPDGAPNDYMVGLMRVREVVEREYGRALSPDVRALCQAYADGLNRYAARHPDEAIAQLYPVRGQDVAAGFVHKLPLFFGLDRTLKELYEPERRRVVSDPPYGSNTIAVAPARSTDGFTRLVVNSHQPWEGPVAWYEAHLHSDEGWDMVGGLFPGAPIVLHGHNRDLGWAHTVNRPDLIDVMVLDVDPADPSRYRFDGRWLTLESRDVAIEVKLLGPLHWTVHREALWSVYGPVVRRPHGTYAIRVAGQGDVRQVEEWYRMNRARSLEEWMAALRLQAIPMMNCGYADAKGHIAYVYNARLPMRDPAFDWTQYVPGNTSRTLWTEYLPFDDLPKVVDPASGFVQSCNSTPFRTTTGAGNPDPSRYPAALGIERGMTNRALRALELLGDGAPVSRDALDAFKLDVAYSARSQTMARLRLLLEGPEPEDARTRAALRELRGWDGRTDAQNPHAALAMLTLQPKDDDAPDAADRDTLLERLRRASLSLDEHFGRTALPWADVNRLRRGGVDLGLGGSPDVLRAVYARPAPDGRLVGTAGDSYNLLVEWDREGRVHSRSIQPYGAATKDARSPHYADQAPLFVRGATKPVWMDEAEIRQHLEREYRPD